MSRITLSALLFAGAAGMLLLAGCGPKYPNCNEDEDCKERGQYCVNKMCKDCADDSHCSSGNPCTFCGEGYSCQKMPNCCTSDLDCPNGRCYRLEGTNYGECGARCRTNEDCPAGQICSGGMCVPDVECTDDSQCPPGKKCINGACVLADCQLETIYFDYNEATLTSDARAKLSSNSDCVKKRGQNVTIEGHADERGSDEYNLALAERRARSAKSYLQQLGVGVNMKTISYGEERPVCTESAESCWWRNRRAEFLFQ
jgi:peptidoglycan-associated lipoprotein